MPREITWEPSSRRKSRRIAHGVRKIRELCTSQPFRPFTQFKFTHQVSNLSLSSVLGKTLSSTHPLAEALSVILPTRDDTLLLNACLRSDDKGREACEKWLELHTEPKRDLT